MVVHEGNSVLLTAGEVARLLNLHINTVRRWSDNGTIRSHRAGPRSDRIFSLDDITHFLAERKEERKYVLTHVSSGDSAR